MLEKDGVMARFSTKIAVAAFVVGATPVSAQTLNEAFATAYATNPSLIAARAGVRAAPRTCRWRS